jgi:hypothetical protein
MPEAFAEDPQVQKVAEAYARDAVNFAQERFNLALDWSDASIAHVETMLTEFDRQVESGWKPTEEKVLQFGTMFGSYIGEVFRRNHGATWGIVTLQGESFPGLQASRGAGLFWPWGRAQNRIRNGAEDNVWHYYQFLVQKNGSSSPPIETTGKQSWWKKLRGG